MPPLQLLSHPLLLVRPTSSTWMSPVPPYIDSSGAFLPNTHCSCSRPPMNKVIVAPASGQIPALVWPDLPASFDLADHLPLFSVLSFLASGTLHSWFSSFFAGYFSNSHVSEGPKLCRWIYLFFFHSWWLVISFKHHMFTWGFQVYIRMLSWTTWLFLNIRFLTSLLGCWSNRHSGVTCPK